MTQKNKISAAVFATLLICTLTGCKKRDALNSKSLLIKVPTLTIQNSPDRAVSESYQFLEKAADAFTKDYNTVYKNKVSIRVSCFPIAEETKYVSESFDTEDAPDVLYEGYFNMATYIHTGRVVPLDDIITQNIRLDIDDSAWAASTVAGRTYMMPYLSLDNVLCYNKKLFKLAGLTRFISDKNIIQTWTMDEWREILETLRANLPKNIYPMMMYARNEQGDTHIMTLLRAFGSDFFDEAGNFNINTQKGVAALKWLLDNYRKGYYPPNAQALEIVENSALFGAGQLAIYLSNSAVVNNFNNIDMGFVNFPCVNGALSTSFITGFEVFDNGDMEKIMLSKAFIKYIYSSARFMDYSSSAIPLSRAVADRYKDRIFMLDEFYKNKKYTWDYTHNNPAWRGVRSVFYRHIQDLFYERRTPEEVASDIDNDCNAQITLGYAKSTLHE